MCRCSGPSTDLLALSTVLIASVGIARCFVHSKRSQPAPLRHDAGHDIPSENYVCTNCCYDLLGTPHDDDHRGICPECGKDFDLRTKPLAPFYQHIWRARGVLAIVFVLVAQRTPVYAVELGLVPRTWMRHEDARLAACSAIITLAVAAWITAKGPVWRWAAACGIAMLLSLALETLTLTVWFSDPAVTTPTIIRESHTLLIACAVVLGLLSARAAALLPSLNVHRPEQ
jgi:hypothetical protein